ncbi:MAG: hypothetical protein ACI8S6_005968 [Myxococcota bacterium]|jgi:hypothetical protein
MTPEDLEEHLKTLDAPALRALVRRMLLAEPTLRGLVVPRSTPSAAVFDPAKMKLRADRIFDAHEPGWQNPGIEDAIDRLATAAQALEGRAAAGDYAGLLLSVAEHIEWQEECEYDGVLEHSTERLRALHDAEEDPQVKAAIVDVFGEVLGFELTTGYGLDRFVAPTFLALASTAQREAVMRRVCDHLRHEQRESDTPPDYSENTAREWLAKLLPGAAPDDWLPSVGDAIPHLLERAEGLVEKWKYSAACTWLKRAQDAHHRIGQLQAFRDYIAQLREKHPRRQSLQDALDRAGL